MSTLIQSITYKLNVIFMRQNYDKSVRNLYNYIHKSHITNCSWAQTSPFSTLKMYLKYANLFYILALLEIVNMEFFLHKNHYFRQPKLI